MSVEKMYNVESIADTLSSVYSYLPGIFAEAVDADPYRSRNTVAHAHQAHQRGLFKKLTQRGHLGQGAVFDVFLYELGEKGRSNFYAVKKTKTRWGLSGAGRGATGQSKDARPLDGVHLAFKEIQIISNNLLRRHPNIVTIIGWDWANDRIPVVIVEYAEAGTLQAFLQSHGRKLKSSARRKICLDIACGLTALHAADVAHGDVKLANVLVFPCASASYIAKLSDFSHAVFGLSQRRKTTYPGSRLYNAPEVRDRDALVSSEYIPLCESFSYGLAVWEILQNGSSFLHGQSLVSNTPDRDNVAESQTEAILLSPTPDELLKRAITALSCLTYISTLDKSLYYRILNLTLRDQPARRKELTTVAVALDITDSASICHFSTQMALRPLAIWDFDPWAKVPAQVKVDYVNQIRSVTDMPLQPDHAELHLILSRCYSEGYGVEVQLSKAVEHLFLAAQADSSEATCILEICGMNLRHTISSANTRLGSNATSQAMSAISKTLGTKHGRINLIDYVRMWFRKTKALLVGEKFSWRNGDCIESYSWDWQDVASFIRDVRESSQLICDVMISYPTILAPTNTATFIEVCARYGLANHLQAAMAAMQELDYQVSSWGEQMQVYQALLIESAKGGQTEQLLRLITYIRDLTKGLETPWTWATASGESPLHFISFLNGDASDVESVVLKLQELGFDIDAAITARYWLPPFGIEVYGTPLQMSVKCDCIRTLEVLLKCGAKVTAPYGNRQSPLELAASLHRDEMVSRLLRSSGRRFQYHGHALRALGAPSKKGWYDRLTADSLHPTKKSTKAVLAAIEDHMRSQTSDQPFGDSEWQEWLQLQDGSAITEAIVAEQREVTCILGLLGLGLGPTTDQGRYSLLSIACGIPKAEPTRKPLLEALLCGSYPGIDRDETIEEWISHWPQFFESFRYSSPTDHDLQSMHMLHVWVASEDISTITTAIKLYPDIFRRIAYTNDGHSRTAFEVAVDVGSYEAYKALSPLGPRDIEVDIERARKPWRRLAPNPILHQLLFLQEAQIKHKLLHNINHHFFPNWNLETEDWTKSWVYDASDRLIKALEDFANWILSKHENRHLQGEQILMTSLRMRFIQLDYQWESRNPPSVLSTDYFQFVWESVLSGKLQLPVNLQRRYRINLALLRGVDGSTTDLRARDRRIDDTSAGRLAKRNLREMLQAYSTFEKNVPAWTNKVEPALVVTSVGSEGVCAWLRFAGSTAEEHISEPLQSKHLQSAGLDMANKENIM